MRRGPYNKVAWVTRATRLLQQQELLSQPLRQSISAHPQENPFASQYRNSPATDTHTHTNEFVRRMSLCCAHVPMEVCSPFLWPVIPSMVPTPSQCHHLDSEQGAVVSSSSKCSHTCVMADMEEDSHQECLGANGQHGCIARSTHVKPP